MGASISGIGTSKIVIEGVESLYPANIDVIPDRIEAGTFLMAGALMGKITLNEVNPEHLDAVLQKLKEVGALIETTSNSVTIEPGGLKSVDMKTAVYPGFATDLQAQWVALMSLADGSSMVTDTVIMTVLVMYQN